MSVSIENDLPNKWHSWSYVAVQALILALLIFYNPHTGLNIRTFAGAGTTCEVLGIIGILVSASSLRKSLTVVPIPKADGKLSTRGLYRYVRHPMYTSVLLFALGIALRNGNYLKYVLVIALLALFYFKSLYEEKYLAQKYPDYVAYARSTPRFIPFSSFWKRSI